MSSARRVGGSLETSGLLDAYTSSRASQSDVAGVSVAAKPVTKRNKNKKKREQQQQREQERRESEPGGSGLGKSDAEEVVLDSWEDMQDADTADVPPPPEFIIDRSAVEERKREEEKEKNNAEKNQTSNPKCEEKSKEEIRKEREAKKKAKQEARNNAKSNISGLRCQGPAEQSAKSDKEAKQTKELQPLTKTNSELKAERRAKQEAQRLAKTEAAAAVDSAVKDLAAHINRNLQRPKTQQLKRQNSTTLFSHLPQYTKDKGSMISCNHPNVHPAIIELGLRYAEGTLRGSNARCLALLNAMKVVIRDYIAPPDRQLSRDLDECLQACSDFLKGCRSHSVSMSNAIRFLKAKINSIDAREVEESVAKTFLIDAIDTFISHVELAAVQISITACEKIRDGDVILSFGCSSLLREVFEKAARSGRKFHVIVADGRPKFEGREMARHLVNAGIRCTYVMVHALSCIIGQVSKVFLGAHAVFANGYVMSRVGSAQVAMIAKAHNVPVLVCCETYKFSERVQTDSFVHNELGDPDELVATGSSVVDPATMHGWRDTSSLLIPLNLLYDVTPAHLVDAIISEISVIPCTSVPVVLRLKTMDLS